MKTLLKPLLVIVPLILSSMAKAQSINDPITLGIFKPVKSRLEYKFNDTNINSIRIKTIGPQKKTYTGGEAARDFFSDLLVSGLGFSTSSSDDMEWELKGKILCTNDAMNWEVLLFCSGEFEKEKEVVKNEDGSKSIETTKHKYVHWEEGATGVILENEVPIGKFGVFPFPRNDSLIYNTYKEAFLDEPEPIKTSSKNRFYIESIDEYIPEYAVLGVFRGEQFTLIANGDSRRMWFYSNNKLIWIFKTDVDNLLPIRKKDRVKPTLQVSKQATQEEMYDWYRMALASKYMSTALLKDEY